MTPTLYGYWRSSASYRVRIALGLKGLAYTYVPVDLRAGQQREAAHLARNPLGLVPALVVGETTLTQSLAIFEWLDRHHPTPPLYPAGAAEWRARALAQMVACDIMPLGNLRVLKYLRHEYALDEAATDGWARHWISLGFEAVETMLQASSGAYAYGDQPGAADAVLVPQAYNAERVGLALAQWPRLAQVVRAARAHPAFIAAAPENQNDAPAA